MRDRSCRGRVGATVWRDLVRGVSIASICVRGLYVVVPSISLCSYTKPLSMDGLAAKGQPHASRFHVPMAWRKLDQMPMSHGNS